MRQIIIGDVHGCIEELQALLGLINLRADDELVFIGDLIDRGPDSIGTVRLVVGLTSKWRVRLVLGNHEEKLLRYLKHIQTGSAAAREMKGTEEFDALINGLGEHEIRFLHTAYHACRLTGGILCLHGGVPATTRLDFRQDYRYDIHQTKQFPGLELINKTRFLDDHGNFVSLGAEKPGWPFWAEVYDGRFGKILFGHNPFIGDQPKIFPHAIGIDTGCVFGGWLTAAVVEEGRMTFQTVKALRIYSTRLQG